MAELNAVYISANHYRELIERAYDAEILGNKAEELECRLKEMQERLDKWMTVDMWFTTNSYYKKCFDEWAAKQGLDDQAVEIERLNGENEELRRAIDELGAQVEYWRQKAGVEDE